MTWQVALAHSSSRDGMFPQAPRPPYAVVSGGFIAMQPGVCHGGQYGNQIFLRPIGVDNFACQPAPTHNRDLMSHGTQSHHKETNISNI